MEVATADTDIVEIDLPEGEELDPFGYKVDVENMVLVPNDRIIAYPDKIVLRAGTGDTAEIIITKMDAEQRLIANDRSDIWVGLVPIIDGTIALPGTVLAGAPPHGRLISRPRGFANGACRIVIQAAASPGTDMVVITQPGLEPVFVQLISSAE